VSLRDRAMVDIVHARAEDVSQGSMRYKLIKDFESSMRLYRMFLLLTSRSGQGH
jgi:hypothetical protein